MALLRHTVARGARWLSALRTARLALARTPVLAPLGECAVPAAITDWLARIEARHDALVLAEPMLPRSAAELPSLLALMRAARAALRPGDTIVWAQPTPAEPLLGVDETAQIIGLLGPMRGIADVTEGARTWRVAVATARPEAAAVALRWPLAAPGDLASPRGTLLRDAMTKLSLGHALHAVDLPEPDGDFASWSGQVRSCCEMIATDKDAVWGVVLPARFAEVPELTERALAFLRSQMKTAGLPGGPRFQWVRGSVPLSASEATIDFARRHAIAFDFTPVSRGSSASALQAYDDGVPYHPLSFDLRLPSFAPERRPPIELARWPDMHGDPAGWLDDAFERQCARLAPVLDRIGQHKYRVRVQRDPTLMDQWPQHFVYNWAPPPVARLRLVEVDAANLGRANVTSDRHWTDARQFLQIAHEAASVSFGLELAAKELQIKEHAYQARRDDITADAERLIGWMPDELGRTLELGSGMGVMARRVGARAGFYVGIDLTTAQAQALNSLGGLGLVADIHAVPLPDASIDTIIADNVVEHASDPLGVLAESLRVLRPGGRGFLIIPPDYSGYGFSNTAHLWKADAASVEQALRRAGFKLVRHETVRLAELGVSGAFPSSQGATDLWQIEKPRGSDGGGR